MDSIAIGWKKQAPNKIEISNKKPRSQKFHHIRKTTPPKQEEASKVTEPNILRTVRFDKLGMESHSYTPLKPTESTLTSTNSGAINLVQMYQDEKLCSARAAIATFVIIAIIVIAAGASIGIALALVKSQNSSGDGSDSNNNNNNNNQNSVVTPATVLPMSSISVGSQTGSPCSSYTEINDPSRNYLLAGSSGPCDNGYPFIGSSGGVWIRFVGSGGTKIVSSPPGDSHCGGHLAGWHNGTLPTPGNPVVNGTICFDSTIFTCNFNNEVSIMYCSGSGGYYVYFLRPVPTCKARYCTSF